MKNFVLAILLFWQIFPSEAANGNGITSPKIDTADSINQTIAIFKNLAKSNKDIADTIARFEKQRTIVFVPGILGSKLTSKEGKVIFGDFSDPKTLFSRLELPLELVDESVESGINAEILKNFGPMDLYGDAIEPMQQWALEHQIKFITCGYDWRRDIRSGARYLDNCLKQKLGDGPQDIILIAHSMGGLVTWNWMSRHDEGQLSPSINVISVTLLGSPLKGSCEIIRMIQSGYIQPKRNDKIKVNTNLRPLKSLTEKWVDAFKNQLSGQFSQGIRPLVLSWPGAIELSPAQETTFGKTSCVGVPADEVKPIGTPGTSYYDPAFWEMVAGRDMLRHETTDSSYELPGTLKRVLDKAKEFRDTFKVEKLKVPVWLYYSQLWLVPSEAGYDAPHISPAAQWTTTWGDGRVPASSAMVVDNPTVFSHIFGLESVHGNLPSDPNFFDDYFKLRLPILLNAALANHVLQQAVEKPEWVAAYSKLARGGPDAAQLQASMEPRVATGKESISLQHALATAQLFNQKICDLRIDCASNYNMSKLFSYMSSATKAEKLAQYSSVIRSTTRDHVDYAYAEGNRGLVLAKSTNWHAAAVSLAKAKESIDVVQENASQTESNVDSKFVDVVEANLAKSLYETGQCKAAEPYLRKSESYWQFARDALSQPCNDVPSGLQYCFDLKNFCPSNR